MKNSFILLTAVLAAVLCGVAAHPTKYHVENPELWLQRIRNGTYPPFFSYHIHVVFVPYENSSVVPAMEFRQKLIQHFGLENTAPCKNIEHNPSVCMFDIDSDPGTANSPFVSGEWAVYLTLDKFQEYVTWTMQNRGDNIVFIHPNSGFQIHDHSKWALWQGDIWPLRLSVLCDGCH